MPGDRRSTARTGAKRVLVVDSGDFGQKFVHDVLGLDGYAVTCATDGDGALFAVAEGDYDLVVLDLGTSRMEGAETVRRIRALAEPRSRVPILILSSLTRIESPTLAMHAANELLLRPVSLAALRDAALRWTSGGLPARAPSAA